MTRTPATRRRLAAVLLAGAAVTAAVAVPAPEAETPRVRNAMPASVMILAADVSEGALVPIASGSGTVVSGSGAILTNRHVITGKGQRPHDVFVVGRLRRSSRTPELVCAGVPAHARVVAALDLALVQCELDLDGLPLETLEWPTVPLGDSEHVAPGERVWVLGYPNRRGLSLQTTFGQVLGWTGEAGGAGDAYIKTDAAITHGNSGGTAIDADGELIGVPSAYRLRREKEGKTAVAVGSVGLIRPIHLARDLVRAARAGWRAGRAPAFGPPAPGPDGAPAPPAPAGGEPDSGDDAGGVFVASRVVDARSGTPVAGAVVTVLEPGTDPVADGWGAIEDRAVTSAATDADGAFRLREPLVRGRTYAVVVTARGYAPLAAPRGLAVTARSPQLHDPWERLALAPTSSR